MVYDAVIVGGGPAGLSAALNLGRARKRVLLCDAGPRRNAAAEHIHGFVTQDGTTPEEFRRIGRRQLEPYPNVDVRDAPVEEIRGERGAFTVRLASGNVEARRILLCTGMVDELPDIEGFRALWGRSIFQCPYCHAWEVQDQRFGFLSPNVDALDFALFLRGWTGDVTVLTDGRYAVPPEMRERLTGGGVRIEERRIARLSAKEDRLDLVEFTDSDPLRLDVLFARPPQRQVAVVQALGLDLDSGGYVRLDERRQTSIPGIYAGGDLITSAQSAVLAAASGVQAAAMINHELTLL
ncbi:MAG TPA: NAD(P)/FAD-dependent oxidoreductase [Thermoanaerobaculia bacterium]|nr:NAD(P)/FAD-dependent oxidoreductase [Thermoanaerobaculia bacterium]